MGWMRVGARSPAGPAAPWVRGASPTTWGRRRSPRQRPRHRPAPAHRAADRHLAGRRPGPAPRQPRLRAGHPARPAQPDDRGRTASPTPRRRPGATAARCTASSSGSRSPRRPAAARRRSSTTPSSAGRARRRRATVLVGDFARRGVAGPRATRRSPASTLALRPRDRAAAAARLRVRRSSCWTARSPSAARPVRPGTLAYLGLGRDELAAGREPARACCCWAASRSGSRCSCGGTSSARTREEIESAYARGRGRRPVRAGALVAARIPAPPPFSGSADMTELVFGLPAGRPVLV